MVCYHYFGCAHASLQSYQPKLTFVTIRPVPAGEELTIDYEPHAQAATMSSRKGKGRIPSGAKVCLCKAEKCRGYLRI